MKLKQDNGHKSTVSFIVPHKYMKQWQKQQLLIGASHQGTAHCRKSQGIVLRYFLLSNKGFKRHKR